MSYWWNLAAVATGFVAGTYWTAAVIYRYSFTPGKGKHVQS